MRRVLPAGSLLLSACMMAASRSHRPAAPTLVGKDAPDFVLKGMDGKNLRLSEFRGQVVLVNFWARWAGDSRQEMPALDRINTTYSGPVWWCSASRSMRTCAVRANLRRP